MALKRFYDGYGQIELNNVAFRRDGRIEAQCHLDKTDFDKIPAENGMLLAVDNVTRTVKLPKANSLPIAINYTSEHMYDDRASGLKDFALSKDSFLPRLGYLAVGDKFTTNCFGSDTLSTVDAVKAAVATGLYGIPCAEGIIKLVTEAPASGLSLRAVKATTMPDGQFALKFQVYAV